jgi:hypothetical protein
MICIFYNQLKRTIPLHIKANHSPLFLTMSSTSSYHSNSIESLRADLIAMQKDMSSMRTQFFNQMNRLSFNEICNLAGFSAVGRKFQNRPSPSSYSTSSHGQTVSSVPLQGNHSVMNGYHGHRGESSYRRPVHHGDRRPRQPQPHPRMSHRVQADRKPQDDSVQSTIQLSQLLANGEEVTFRVIVGKDENGNPTYTNTLATFDGTHFRVTFSELVPSLVGLTSSKPGEILYKLIDGLTQAGHLTRKFSIAPWRLCFVKRDGNYVSLNQLRLDSLNRS